MATINYITKGKSNPVSIYLRFKQGNDLDITKNTGYIVDWKNWSAKKKTVLNLKDASSKLLDKNLRELKDTILDNYNNTELHRINAVWLEKQIALFKGEISTNDQLSDYVTDYVQHVMQTAHTRGNDKKSLGLSTSRIKSYGNLLQMFKRYQGKKAYRIKDIDRTFAQNFLDFMLTKQGSSQSYACKILSDLKTTCKDASYNGIEINKQLVSIKIPTTKNENIIYLNNSELETIQSTELKRTALVNARRWLILGCHIGQRGNDLLNLNESNLNVHNGVEVIELKQTKTNNDVIVNLPKVARDILATGFPTKITTQTFNKHLKEICKLAGLNEPTKGRVSEGKNQNRKLGVYPKYKLIGSHVCRRSFVSNYYGQLPTPLLMQISGHKTERMLLQYLGKSTIDYVTQIDEYYRLKEARDVHKLNGITMKIVKKRSGNG